MGDKVYVVKTTREEIDNWLRIREPLDAFLEAHISRARRLGNEKAEYAAIDSRTQFHVYDVFITEFMKGPHATYDEIVARFVAIGKYFLVSPEECDKPVGDVSDEEYEKRRRAFMAVYDLTRYGLTNIGSYMDWRVDEIRRIENEGTYGYFIATYCLGEVVEEVYEDDDDADYE